MTKKYVFAVFEVLLWIGGLWAFIRGWEITCLFSYVLALLIKTIGMERDISELKDRNSN